MLLVVVSGSTDAQFAYVGMDVETIKARIVDLNPPEKGLPNNQFSLGDERRTVEDEIHRLRSILADSEDMSEELAQVEKLKKIYKETIEQVNKADCAIGEFEDPSKKVRQASVGLPRWYVFAELEGAISPWDGAPVTDMGRESRTATKICKEWKTFVGDRTNQDELLAYPENLRKALLDKQRRGQELKAQAAVLLDLLQKRREVILQKLTETANQNSLSNNLWVVIGIIGFLSVSAIFVVKLFDHQIQIEWVASGQVIQFVTVMILLSVIMALGLAGILKENTLGTLLGGIAGYVLAQGVGRAVARDVTRAVGSDSR